jgi:hypothetical protein
VRACAGSGSPVVLLSAERTPVPVRSVGMPLTSPSAHCCTAMQGNKYPRVPCPLASCYAVRPEAKHEAQHSQTSS